MSPDVLLAISPVAHPASTQAGLAVHKLIPRTEAFGNAPKNLDSTTLGPRWHLTVPVCRTRNLDCAARTRGHLAPKRPLPNLATGPALLVDVLFPTKAPNAVATSTKAKTISKNSHADDNAEGGHDARRPHRMTP